MRLYNWKYKFKHSSYKMNDRKILLWHFWVWLIGGASSKTKQKIRSKIWKNGHSLFGVLTEVFLGRHVCVCVCAGGERSDVMYICLYVHAICVFPCVHIKGFQPEWYISTMIYSCDIPFWLETLNMFACLYVRETDGEGVCVGMYVCKCMCVRACVCVCVNVCVCVCAHVKSCSLFVLIRALCHEKVDYSILAKPWSSNKQ